MTLTDPLLDAHHTQGQFILVATACMLIRHQNTKKYKPEPSSDMNVSKPVKTTGNTLFDN